MRGTKVGRRLLAGAFAASLIAASCSSGNATTPSSAVVTSPTPSTPTSAVVTSATVGTAAATPPASQPPTATTPSEPTGTAPSDTTGATDAPVLLAPLTPADTPTGKQLKDALDANKPGCDPLDRGACLLPFPSNAYTVADKATDTGLRVDMAPGSAGANDKGVPVELTEWNRNDGFSPDSTLLTYVPGIDATASKLPSWTDLQASSSPDATVVLVDTDTGNRIPLWAELDPKAASDASRSLIIHPAVSLPEGHHFVVALRGMKVTAGTPIASNVVFRAYRDRLTATPDDATFESRRPAMESTFGVLGKAGIDRKDLYLAWDFTVASQRSLSERMLSIRDQALDTLGTAAPAFTMTSVTPNTSANIAQQIVGTYTVPNFLSGDGSPGQAFNYGTSKTPDRLPVQNGTLQAPFVCNISTATTTATTPAHLVEYGHGLLGDNTEIDAGNVRDFANESNIVFCATKWAGLSADDIPNAALTLGEISNFPTVADRLQQGVLNQIFLGRLMTRSGGLSSLAAFTRADGSSMIDTSALSYDGNSQGGIMGIMLAAVSPDIQRAVLGVSGINYSLLLPRSVDFAKYEAIFKPAYPNDIDRQIDVDLLQMLWDRGEGGGYVQHVTTNPYEGTAAKTVLMDIAFGDWQVSELSAMVAARSMGVPISRPVTAPGRSEEVDPGWGLGTLTYPSKGSGMIVWDSGSDPIPLAPLPPSTGFDPHEHPRRDPAVRKQKAAFLFDHTLIDVCGAAACTAARND